MLRAAWDLIRNPPIEDLDDDGTVVWFSLNRRERFELMKPEWWYTIFTRELSCGCTKRWWGTFTLYRYDCPQHGILTDEAD